MAEPADHHMTSTVDLYRRLASEHLRDASASLTHARRALTVTGLDGTDWLTEWAVIAADLAHELDNLETT